MYVTHDRVHCHWRWQYQFPLFASFSKWIKASLPNNAIVSLQRLSHLMPVDHFFSGNLNNKVLATFPCDLEDHYFAHIWHDLLEVWVIIWQWWDRTCRTCSIADSSVLKSEVDMLKMWVHKRTRAENNPTNHYPKQILITCNDHPNF